MATIIKMTKKYKAQPGANGKQMTTNDKVKRQQIIKNYLSNDRYMENDHTIIRQPSQKRRQRLTTT